MFGYGQRAATPRMALLCSRWRIVVTLLIYSCSYFTYLVIFIVVSVENSAIGINFDYLILCVLSVSCHNRLSTNDCTCDGTSAELLYG